MIDRSEKIARETGVSTGKVIKVTMAMKAEPGDLRGIPVQAKGIGGVIPGTNPLAALMSRQPKDDEA